MNTNINELNPVGTESLRAYLPNAPTTSSHDRIYRAIKAIRFCTRFRFLPRGLIFCAIGVLLFVLGLALQNEWMQVAALVPLVWGLVFVVRLSPMELHALVNVTERECEKMIQSYATQCEEAVTGFCDDQHTRWQGEARSLVKTGAALAHIQGQFQYLWQSLQSNESKIETELESFRTRIKQLREDYQRRKSGLASLSKNLRAQFLPGVGRRAARSALEALETLTHAQCEETQIQASIKAFRALAQTANDFACQLPAAVTENGNSDSPKTNDLEQIPCWLGNPLPSRDSLRAEAVNTIQKHLPEIRERVLQLTSDGVSSKDAIEQAVDGVLEEHWPGPVSINQYLIGLNGNNKAFADRVWKEASELCPIRPIPGRQRQSKLLVFSDGGGHSEVCKTLRESGPESVPVVGHEHVTTELLVVKQEENLLLSEVPEAMGCIESFRKLPPNKQALLITSLENDGDLFNYYPELPQDAGNASQLLGLAVALQLVDRTGSQEYRLGGRTFAKGYLAAEEKLKADKKLAAALQTKVEQFVSTNGLAVINTQLEAAKKEPTQFVPKEYVEEFVNALERGFIELSRRSVASVS